jgi:protoheme IX farnesyltransferase
VEILSKPLVFFDSTDAIRGAEASEADRSATWKDFLHILKMGIVFSNLITTFAGLWLALDETGQSFFDHIGTVIAALVGSGLVMAGGCALNNFIDRDIDQLMERTKDRPSATGQLTARQVFWTGIIMSTLGTIVLIQASYTAAVLGLVGLFVYVVVYTLWLKRTHSINTIVGGISGAIPPVIGWAAIDPGLVSLTPWLLFLIVFLWQPPHFLALAIKRVDEYRRAGVPMLPVVAGMNMTKRQMIFYVVLLLPASLMLYELGPLYLTFAVLLGIGWIAVAVAGLFTKDVMKWSKRMFVYSLNYLTILFIVMVVSVL